MIYSNEIYVKGHVWLETDSFVCFKGWLNVYKSCQEIATAFSLCFYK